MALKKTLISLFIISGERHTRVIFLDELTLKSRADCWPTSDLRQQKGQEVVMNSSLLSSVVLRYQAATSSH